MRSERIAQQLEQLKAKHALAVARERADERKRDLRRRIVLGGELLRQWGGPNGMPAAFRQALDAHLRRDDDRALFGLPPRG